MEGVQCLLLGTQWWSQTPTSHEVKVSCHACLLSQPQVKHLVGLQQQSRMRMRTQTSVKGRPLLAPTQTSWSCRPWRKFLRSQRGKNYKRNTPKSVKKDKETNQAKPLRLITQSCLQSSSLVSFLTREPPMFPSSRPVKHALNPVISVSVHLASPKSHLCLNPPFLSNQAQGASRKSQTS